MFISDLDKCEMKTFSENKVGSQNDAYDISQRNLEGCKSACIADSKCKQASFVSDISFCLLFDRDLETSEFIDESSAADLHMYKDCFIGNHFLIFISNY